MDTDIDQFHLTLLRVWINHDFVNQSVALLLDLILNQRPAVTYILESLHLLEQFRLQYFLRNVLFVQYTVQHLRLLVQLMQLPLERIVEDLEIHHALLFWCSAPLRRSCNTYIERLCIVLVCFGTRHIAFHTLISDSSSVIVTLTSLLYAGVGHVRQTPARFLSWVIHGVRVNSQDYVRSQVYALKLVNFWQENNRMKTTDTRYTTVFNETNSCNYVSQLMSWSSSNRRISILNCSFSLDSKSFRLFKNLYVSRDP